MAVEEIDYALRPAVHERRVPSFGAIVAPTLDPSGWEQRTELRMALRPVGDTGKANTWHTGLIPGTSTLLVRRWDGLNWAVLFNTEANPQGEVLSGLIDGPLHTAADAVREWPG